MSGAFSDESSRTQNFSSLLNEYLRSISIGNGITISKDIGENSKQSHGKSYETEASILGVLPHFPTGIKAFLMNREDKNEKGHGGGESYLQNACYYTKFHGRSSHKDLIRASCCPTFLVELVGPAICISGAVYHECISIDPLTPMLYLFFLLIIPL